jgi:hypothetical protein
MKRHFGPLGLVIVASLVGVSSVIPACGGRSTVEGAGLDNGAQNASGGSVGTTGCEYNGTHYDLGQSFGNCNECSCSPTGGVSCELILCSSNAGGTNGAGGGANGSGGHPNGSGGTTAPGSGNMSGTTDSGNSATGCVYAGTHYDYGASWQDGAVTCTCGVDRIACVPNGTAGSNTGTGTGGTGATGGSSSGSAGRSMGGMAGNPLLNESCQLELGEICIEGDPAAGGVELSVGKPIVFSIYAYGCGGCTQVTRSSCQIIGSGQTFAVAGFVCSHPTGAHCSGCTQGPASTCDTGATLSAGDYSINVSGDASATMSQLKFTVPGFLSDNDRCTHQLL